MKVEKARLIYRILLLSSLVCVFIAYIFDKSLNINMTVGCLVLCLILHTISSIFGLIYLRCPGCSKHLITGRALKYCPHCGRAIE